MNTSSKRRVQHDGHAQGRHAVVLGGSLAGLLAARVLACTAQRIEPLASNLRREFAQYRAR